MPSSDEKSLYRDFNEANTDRDRHLGTCERCMEDRFCPKIHALTDNLSKLQKRIGVPA